MINAITESLRGSPYVLQEGTGREILSAAQKLAEDVELLRQNGSLDDEVLSELRKEWGVKQVYESAGIEGNELTLNETLLAIQRGVTISGKPPGQSDEVRNLNMALHFLEELFREAKPLGEWEIREVQKLVLGINDPNGGRYRDIEVAISNSPHKPPHPIRVPVGPHSPVFRWERPHGSCDHESPIDEAWLSRDCCSKERSPEVL